jgi:hypothetical protein
MPKISPTTILLIIILAAGGGYIALTYPRSVGNITVSFSIGAESKTVEFDLPPLHDEFQVNVSVKSGNAIWNARLVSGNLTVWSHTASQGVQTSYQSGWVSAQPGHYRFTFSTIGFGSLVGDAEVTTRGGLW